MGYAVILPLSKVASMF